MMDEIKIGPTGRYRVRSHKQFFGPVLLVLQIEVVVSANEGAVTFIDWRDASAEDLPVKVA